jgi:hypothetical protein
MVPTKYYEFFKLGGIINTLSLEIISSIRSEFKIVINNESVRVKCKSQQIKIGIENSEKRIHR